MGTSHGTFASSVAPARLSSGSSHPDRRLIGKGEGIQWLDLDEDISIESLFSGRPSTERAEALK
jgi:hypothetical protein